MEDPNLQINLYELAKFIFQEFLLNMKMNITWLILRFQEFESNRSEDFCCKSNSTQIQIFL